MKLPATHAAPRLARAARVLSLAVRALALLAIAWTIGAPGLAAAAPPWIPPPPDPPEPWPAPVVFGFYVNWEPSARDSLLRHAADLTHFAPEWLRLSDDGTDVVDTRIPEDRAAVEPLVRAHGLPILPLINNFAPASQASGQGDWNGGEIDRMLASPVRRALFVERLKRFIMGQRWQGVSVDFERIAPEHRDDLTQLMRELNEAFHPAGLLVTQEIHLDDPAYDVEQLARWNDFVIPTLYQEHSIGDGPASIAGIPWTRQQLARIFARVPAEKVVVAFANYAYDWADGATTAQTLTYQGAVTQARELHELDHIGRASIALDPQSLNPFYRYEDDQGATHSVWLMDATTTYNQWTLARPYRPRGVALWHMGGEDPSVWSVIGKRAAGSSPGNPAAARELRQVSYGAQPWISYEGEGELLELASTPADGRRSIDVDPRTGLIAGASYLDYPAHYVVRRYGRQSKQIVLTFDDGPDPRYTPQILDILKREKVPAVFFVVGQAAQRNPTLVERIWNEGHEIGNHTFTHPRLEQGSAERTRLEINAAQRVIETITGHTTTLFRPPYDTGSDPRTPEELETTLVASSWNFIVVTDQIDPQDWRLTVPGPGGQLIARASDDIAAAAWRDRDAGNIILLHDGGGDRSATVAALPKIIEQYRAAGYQFTTLSALSGVPRDQLLPPLSGPNLVAYLFNRTIFWGSYLIQPVLWVLFVLSIVLGVSRQVLIMVLALVQRARERQRLRDLDPNYRPLVSVIIAAYNEEKVIERTVETLLASDYPNLEIVVVDDGSADRTFEVAMAAFGGEPRVSCYRKPNGGKASALNHGLARARGEVIIGLDADTLFAPDTIGRLVRHFSDPLVGAVAGNVKVGNANNLLTRWQSLEYITSQNFDRRAYDLLNCITVVPGAIGAWRASAIAEVGGYTHDTLAEDTDLTWKIRRSGWLIRNESTALAFTEAPETLANLTRQRYRWAFGTLQNLWKHRAALFREGAFGWFAMPSLWMYQIVFQAIAPVMDVMIVVSLITGNFAPVIQYAALVFAADVLGAILALALDTGGRAWRLLPWLAFQRFLYRQLMYYVILKSLQSAIVGHAVGWNKFERRGTAKIA